MNTITVTAHYDNDDHLVTWRCEDCEHDSKEHYGIWSHSSAHLSVELCTCGWSHDDVAANPEWHAQHHGTRLDTVATFNMVVATGSKLPWKAYRITTRDGIDYEVDYLSVGVGWLAMDCGLTADEACRFVHASIMRHAARMQTVEV